MDYLFATAQAMRHFMKRGGDPLMFGALTAIEKTFRYH